MMRRVVWIAGFIVLILLVLAGSALVYLTLWLPNVGDPPSITVQQTPERIARGRYLAHHVSVCMDCHSKRNWRVYSGPPVPGTWGQGGEKFLREAGFPGNFYAPNITPAGVGSWTDGELFRAITAGVDRHGDALFPVMPYPAYGTMSRPDIRAIIAYVRQLEPKRNRVPESNPDFPMNLIIHTLPSRPDLQPRPPVSDTVAYGGYITTAAACGDCHTPMNAPDKPFSGGRAFQLPTGGTIHAANITPDPETGIGTWTRRQFISRFKRYENIDRAVKPGEQNTVMPWTMYAGMTREDLGAIYRYLQSVEPVQNEVKPFSPPGSNSSTDS